ncbi:hypothetical protein PAMP_024455 [Pampus punctatissimus]
MSGGPPNRCGSLCGTNRPEAEGCLCPFSLITSHLCVHKQTNTAINLRAWYKLMEGGRKIREKETDGGRSAVSGGFVVIPWVKASPQHTLPQSLERSSHNPTRETLVWTVAHTSNTSFNRDVVKAGTGRRFLGGLLDDTSYCYTLEVSFYSYMTAGTTAPVPYTEETCILQYV